MMTSAAALDPEAVIVTTVFFATIVAGVWLLLRCLTRLADEVPTEDRSYRDPPPRYWRLIGWGGHAVGYWVGPWIARSMRRRLMTRLRRAGLEYALTVDLFVAGQVVAALVAAGAMGLAWSPIGTPSPVAWFVCAVAGAALPVTWLRDRIERRSRQIAKALPFYLDVITLAIEAGSNLTGALQHAADKGPQGPLAEELHRVLRDVRAGRTRAESLRLLAERLQMPAISNWVAAVLTAEQQGSSLGPILRAQAEQRRNERFLRAEALALKAPVKMLFPLMTCIFPCTFVIVFFPIVVRILAEGLVG